MEDLDPQKIELEMLHRLPLADLYQVPMPSARLSRERGARLQELLQFATAEGFTYGGMINY